MLYFFYERGFIPRRPRNRREKHETVSVEYKVSGDVVFVRLPGQDKPLQVPVSYMGYQLRVPHSNAWFTMPRARRQSSSSKRTAQQKQRGS